jgi:hypothetical protein
MGLNAQLPAQQRAAFRRGGGVCRHEGLSVRKEKIMVDAMVPYNEPNARLNVTYEGNNGDYPDPVDYNAADADVLQIATEAIRTGYIPGIAAMPNADLTDFVVERFPAVDDLPPRLLARPKTPFGQ